jgi:hypothetical protein
MESGVDPYLPNHQKQKTIDKTASRLQVSRIQRGRNFRIEGIRNKSIGVSSGFREIPNLRNSSKQKGERAERTLTYETL